MTKTQIITACKLACRVSSQALDSEFSELVDAAFLDLEISGVADVNGNPYKPETSDQLVVTAVKTYVKLHLGDLLDMTAYDKLSKSYWDQVATLKMRTHSDSKYEGES